MSRTVLMVSRSDQIGRLCNDEVGGHMRNALYVLHRVSTNDGCKSNLVGAADGFLQRFHIEGLFCVVQHNALCACRLYSLGQNASQTSAGNERIHMLCEHENSLSVVGEKLDVGILRGNDDVNVVFHRRFVNHLRELEHSLAPDDRLRANLEKRRLDVEIFKHNVLLLPFQYF